MRMLLIDVCSKVGAALCQKAIDLAGHGYIEFEVYRLPQLIASNGELQEKARDLKSTAFWTLVIAYLLVTVPLGVYALLTQHS